MTHHIYGEHQWHSEYQALAKTAMESELRYIIKDCQEAIAANPDNPKANQYADEINYCSMELHRRSKV